jgi:predicted RNA-binding Zn-ribbon protein involved in translation (DUF1610 family)
MPWLISPISSLHRRFRPTSGSESAEGIRLEAVGIDELTPSQPVEKSSARKTALHCPNCGHESRIDGDWNVRVHGNCADYDCPVCDTTITSRPGPGRQADRRDGNRCYCVTP